MKSVKELVADYRAWLGVLDRENVSGDPRRSIAKNKKEIVDNTRQAFKSRSVKLIMQTVVANTKDVLDIGLQKLSSMLPK